MRIAHITSTYLSVPPRSHGGTELMVYHLVQGLARRRHDVELFASDDSRVDVPLRSVVALATSYDPDATAYLDKEIEARNTFNLYRQAARFDLIHAHWPTIAPYFTPFAAAPTVITYHYMEAAIHAYYRASFHTLFPVCVSRAQARMLGEPSLPVVYNGIDLDATPFNDHPEDFLVIVARLVPTKGIAEAIRIARAAGERLVIIGHPPPQIPWSRAYYDEQIKPHVDGDRVRHFADLPHAQVLDWVARAKAFLFPIQWEEPFGLVVAEALAAGTPVVAFRRGAMPEIIDHGRTGFLVDTEQDAVRALRDIAAIHPAACRAAVAQRFSLTSMLDGYEALYRNVLNANPPS
ncbi:MAG: glycosyltransferase family 4 protein [Dehalococcoidia bacterium]|nr:glycosyltransferase family 4 protein [Dehalococcoidia bacterium]